VGHRESRFPQYRHLGSRLARRRQRRAALSEGCQRVERSTVTRHIPASRQRVTRSGPVAAVLGWPPRRPRCRRPAEWNGTPNPLEITVNAGGGRRDGRQRVC